jgi:hypothetical protein
MHGDGEETAIETLYYGKRPSLCSYLRQSAQECSVRYELMQSGAKIVRQRKPMPSTCRRTTEAGWKNIACAELRRSRSTKSTMLATRSCGRRSKIFKNGWRKSCRK